ncbi:SubName: Full=Uncharacterized protein {ECO:0000313/EMBL:CCA75799.1} [Serendipita indica DSM 11827]|uniref:F-box domain-containing protein n=1 Tax=Serendipita indica (strain DSM 11827) TaxID=1109443 RepID=G4TWV6_SERID|nr:SubName: Full=Uncharacterized protein {ECO:0000313/EMBL:CCA75799.1} [Serendipita indica DSM 11827]CCA75799.1 hypothetical protein PIIN_09787 [Serendipita indica DSM 11827]
MSFHLPNELWEIIFDGLLGRRRTLKACSLVCRSWKTLAWKRLFRILYLRYPKWEAPEILPNSRSWNVLWARPPKQTPAPRRAGEGWAPMLRFFNSPLHPTQHTTKIRIEIFLHESVVSPPSGIFKPGSSRFPQLREIHVSAFNLPLRTGEPWAYLNNIISQVTTLELAHVNFRSFDDFMALLASSRCIELIMSDSTWRTATNVQSSPPRLHPPPMHRLSLARIDTLAITALCDWLGHFNHLPKIREVTLRGCSPNTAFRSGYKQRPLVSDSLIIGLFIMLCAS